MEGAAWPEAGATELWDIHSHVFTETTHRTYVYQASDMGATSKWGPSRFHMAAVPGGRRIFAWRGLKSHLACPSLAIARAPAAPLPVSPQKASLGVERQASVTLISGPIFLHSELACFLFPALRELRLNRRDALPDCQGFRGSQEGVAFTWEAGSLFHSWANFRAFLPT